MARDSSATSNTPDPNLVGMCSPMATVNLAVEGGQTTPPNAVISLNNVPASRIPVHPEYIVLDVAPQSPRQDFNCTDGQCVLTVNSRSSTATSPATIKGVRFNIPDGRNPDGTQKFKWVPTTLAEYPNAIQITDNTGKTQLWLPPNSDSPDTIGGKVFKYGEGYGTLRDRWTYELQVVDSNNVVSGNIPRMTVQLTRTVGKPVAKCNMAANPLSVKPLEAVSPKINAVGSTDPQNLPLTVQWSIDSGNTWVSTGTGNIHSNPPATSYPASDAGKTMSNIRVRVTNGTTTSDPVTCSIKVEQPVQKAPLELDFMFMENRATIAGPSADIVVGNLTKPLNQIPNDSNNWTTNGIYWQYFSAVNSYDTVPRTNIIGSKTTASVTLRLNGKTGAFPVYLFATDTEGNPVCGASSTRDSAYSGSPGRVFCRKDVMYFRLKMFSERGRVDPETERMEVLERYTVNPGIWTIDDFIGIWRAGVLDTYNGIRVRDQIQSILNLNRVTWVHL